MIPFTSSQHVLSKPRIHPNHSLALSDATNYIRIIYTPSVPNYKSFQEFWRVKVFQVWLNLYDKIITFMIPIIIRFFVSYIFIVHLFDVINLYISLYNFGQTLKWFDSPKFLEWLIIWNGWSTIFQDGGYGHLSLH